MDDIKTFELDAKTQDFVDLNIIIALFKSFVRDKVITNKECDSLIEYVKRTMILEEKII
jgi:hypothetical protein